MTHPAFDPNYKFPPLPIRDPLHELVRIEAAVRLLDISCPHCTLSTKAIAADGTLPRALGIDHEPGCPA